MKSYLERKESISISGQGKPQRLSKRLKKEKKKQNDKKKEMKNCREENRRILIKLSN